MVGEVGSYCQLAVTFFFVSPYQTRENVVPQFIFDPPPFYTSGSAPAGLVSCLDMSVCCCCFFEQGTLLTLLQYTQLYVGDLVAWCHLEKQPTQLYHQWVPEFYWGSKFPSVFVSLGSVGVVLDFELCNLSPRDLDSPPVGYYPCPRRLKCLSRVQASQCWFLGSNVFHMAAVDFFFALCLYSACVFV